MIAEPPRLGASMAHGTGTLPFRPCQAPPPMIIPAAIAALPPASTSFGLASRIQSWAAFQAIAMAKRSREPVQADTLAWVGQPIRWR